MKHATNRFLVFVVMGLALLLPICAAAQSNVVVGYSAYTMSNPYFSAMVNGFQKAADSYGYKLITTNANGDAYAQLNQCYDMLNKGVSVLVITPIDAQAIVPAIKRANKKGIPVFCCATSAGSGGKVENTTAMDHTGAGKQAADEMAALLKARYGSKKVKVVEIEGPLTEAAGLERHQGFTEEIAKYPNIKVVGSQTANFDASQAFNVMSSMITAHPDVDAVMSANNTMTIGVLKALKSAGHLKPVGESGHVIVVGIDGGPTDWAYLKKGYLDATVAENPVLLAKQTIGYAKAVLAGQTVPANTPQEGLLITKANMNSKEAAGYSWGAAAKN